MKVLMELKTQIWEYIEEDYSDLPFFLIEKLNVKDYTLLNSKYSNEKVLNSNLEEIVRWHKIADSTLGHCFIESGECVLNISGEYWWGVRESVHVLGALTTWSIVSKIRLFDKAVNEICHETNATNSNDTEVA